MEKNEIIIRLYEILNREGRGEINICKAEEADFEDGLEQGRNIESRYFEKGIQNLIREIKSKK